MLTLPTIGNSTEPHVSAAQCTRPDPKSAVMMPQKAATNTMPIRSKRKYRIIRNRFSTISVMQTYTQVSSCIRLPAEIGRKEIATVIN